MSLHFVEPDAPRYGRQRRALCGELIDPKDMSNEPTCEECARRLSDDETHLAELQNMGPSPNPVKHQPFDPLKGYRESRKAVR